MVSVRTEYKIVHINQHSKPDLVENKFNALAVEGFEFVKELNFGMILFAKFDTDNVIDNLIEEIDKINN